MDNPGTIAEMVLDSLFLKTYTKILIFLNTLCNQMYILLVFCLYFQD